MKTKFMLLFAAFMLTLGMSAKKYPQIKFETTVIDFGTFSMDDAVRKCTFKFTNVGDAKLVINSVNPSCGCTVADDYPKDFIAPGGSGEIHITYNGKGKSLGPFRKVIRVETNSKETEVRLVIQGKMTDVPVSKKTKD